jgi:hypothetical protein
MGWIAIGVLLGSVLCSCSSDKIVAVDTANYAVEIDAKLSSDADGYYYLTLDRNRTQTIHTLYGWALRNGEPVRHAETGPPQGVIVEWNSSHEWILSDSLMYIINRPCPYPNDDQIDCVWVVNGDVQKDTIYLSQYEGHTVPTVNESNYSTADGEINTVFAPVWWMSGDTVLITARAYFHNGAEAVDSIQVILE